MARLHEYQGKQLLKELKIPIPHGGLAHTPEEAFQIATELGKPVVVKAQVWITGRAAAGAIRFCNSAIDTEKAASELIGSSIQGYMIETVLVEEQLSIEREFYAGLIIDDQSKAPVLIFSSIGGSGIEEIALQHPEAVVKQVIDIRRGLPDYEARDLVRAVGIRGRLLLSMGNLLPKLFQCARNHDARSAEINPLVLTSEGKLIAADCRITVDDYATYRNPGLNIEVAREYDRPPTDLEKIAWLIEKNDYRGTFYFIQMEQDFHSGDGVIGFHGAGGGGSMMSMDALLNRGYKLANFVDTSGNPPASKVYRAARIILAQGEIDGYFASGSGVASQEQFHSARGLVKAFMEVPLTVPAVIRLGGNAEDQAITILEKAQVEIPAPVEGYGKDDTPEYCVERLDTLIHSYNPPETQPTGMTYPEPEKPYIFETVTGGKVILDHAACVECETKICIDTCVPGILELVDGLPELKISAEDAKKGSCTECLACQIECFFDGNRGGQVLLPIQRLDQDH